MKTIVVPSAQYTGTHLVRYEVLKAFMTNPQEIVYFNGDTPNVMIGFHTWDDKIKENVKNMEGFTVVVPMRHPSKSKETFKRRNLDSMDLYDMQWKNLIREVSKYSPMYIHIDQPGLRNDQVKEVAEVVGLPLKTDWPVVRSKTNTYELNIDECEPAPDEYINFYYEAMKI